MTDDGQAYCEGCEKRASIHLTDVVDGKVTEMHLCDDCPLLEKLKMEKQFGLADLLAGLVDFTKHIQSEDSLDLKCEACGMSYESFRKEGRLGCSDCYGSFETQMGLLLKKIHGSNQYLGKRPKVKRKAVTREMDQLEGLKLQLEEAIGTEDFELAARLRDEIRKLEGRG